MIEVKNQVPDQLIEKMTMMGHEQVVFCADAETGLRAIIAIHSTTLGPALGGVRMWNYINEEDALKDVLRLSRGMTYKAAISGLDLGGGKAVIIGDSNSDKTESLMKKFGECIDNLGGKYITAEDVGMTIHDMECVRSKTKHVTGIPESMGGSGDPSPVTAYGVYMGMKASAKFKWGIDSLSGKKILIQGVGKVGENLLKHISQEKAKIYISDINETKLKHLSSKYDVEIVRGDGIYDLDIDVYAPCALGATLNTDTIERLKCDIIAGSANNQLENENIHGQQIKNKGIVYAPDFLISAGGLINVYSELMGYDREKSLQKTRKIFDTTLEILLKAENQDITTHEAAFIIAKERIRESKK